MKDNTFHDIKIRPITKEDFSSVLVWNKDEEFCKTNDWEQNRSEEELLIWWLHCVQNTAKDFLRLGIEYDDKLIGYTDLSSIKGNTAELGIAIGDSNLWGKGIGYNASIHALEYGVENLGITVFDAETHEDNLRAQKMLEKLGFEEISSKGVEEYPRRRNQWIQYKLVL